jgi:peptidoglycan/xylan/chitin deacetylase (PgdA/CDA1 family)
MALVVIVIAALFIVHELTAPAPYHGVTLSNNASAGRVVFTFDDGPTAHTQQLVQQLHNLGIKAIVFNIGLRALKRPTDVKAEEAAGMVIGNHTMYHQDLTGASAGTPALTRAQARAELAQGNAALVSAGASEPTLWCPPYGDASTMDKAVATSLGLRMVAPWGSPLTSGIVDSGDWIPGITASQIVSRAEHGYRGKWFTPPDAHWPGIRGGSVILFHDGPAWREVRAALPRIVEYMNRHHLGATVVPPASAGQLVSGGNGGGD